MNEKITVQHISTELLNLNRKLALMKHWTHALTNWECPRVPNHANLKWSHKFVTSLNIWTHVKNKLHALPDSRDEADPQFYIALTWHVLSHTWHTHLKWMGLNVFHSHWSRYFRIINQKQVFSWIQGFALKN